MLRAAAFAADAPAGPVAAVDLVAAVVGAHALHAACGASALAALPRAGQPATCALAAVLTRAAGAGAVRGLGEAVDALTYAAARTSLPAVVLCELETAAAWADAHCPGSGAALATAAADLACGAGDPRVAAAADVLVALAEDRLRVPAGP